MGTTVPTKIVGTPNEGFLLAVPTNLSEQTTIYSIYSIYLYCLSKQPLQDFLIESSCREQINENLKKYKQYFHFFYPGAMSPSQFHTNHHHRRPRGILSIEIGEHHYRVDDSKGTNYVETEWTEVSLKGILCSYYKLLYTYCNKTK